MNKRNYQILKYLKETEEYVTSETLSAMNNVSTKTILKDIKSLNCDMKATDNYIEVTPSRGIKLVINDIEEFINLCNSFNDTNDFSIYSVTEREEWIQKYLIENNGWVKAEALCEKLFISQSVLSQNIKSVRKAFQKYDLILLQKPHYGMRVEGREFNKRLCLAQIYITHIDQREGFPGTQFNNDELQLILKIEDIVDRILTRYQISMSEVSVQNFIIDIYISLKRIKKGIFLKSTDKMVIDIARWTDSIVAVELAKLINDELTIEMKDQEIVSLSIHLAAKRIICHFDESIHRIIEDFDVNKLVNNMINNINCKWGIDLTQDEELKSQLVLHLIPLEVRSWYNVVLHNPLIDKIKQQNIFAYQMAVTACDQFSDYHGNRLSEDEMGYIALHMNLALLRTQIKNKKNILVVSGLGRGTAHTLAYQIKEMYGKYINEVKTADYIELNNYDFTNINLLISSIPLRRDFSVPSIEVNYFFSDNDKKRIETILCDQEVFKIRDYIDKRMVLTSINADTKEEAISFIINSTNYDKNIIQEIIENDKVANHELDNMISILSLNGISANNQTEVIIGILSKPILWNEKRVQLIIVPLIGEPINSKILNLYHELAYMIKNPLYVKRIIRKKTYEEIIAIFEEIETVLER